MKQPVGESTNFAYAVLYRFWWCIYHGYVYV